MTSDRNVRFHELRRAFIDNIGEALPAIREVALRNPGESCPERVRRFFHDLTGSAGSYGFETIGHKASEIQEAIDGGATCEAIGELFDALECRVSKTAEELGETLTKGFAVVLESHPLAAWFAASHLEKAGFVVESIIVEGEVPSLEDVHEPDLIFVGSDLSFPAIEQAGCLKQAGDPSLVVVADEETSSIDHKDDGLVTLPAPFQLPDLLQVLEEHFGS